MCLTEGAAMQQWLDFANEGNLDKIVSLYGDPLTFHPTLSSDFIRGRDETRSYFKEFLSRKPRISVSEQVIHSLDSFHFLATGVMAIELNESSTRETVIARFSFIWRLDSGAWRILHHHNSLCPRPNYADSTGFGPTS